MIDQEDIGRLLRALEAGQMVSNWDAYHAGGKQARAKLGTKIYNIKRLANDGKKRN